MESLIRLCWRLDHSTPNGYWPLSLRGRRLGVRLTMAVVPQPTSRKGSRSRGTNLFIVAIMRQSVTRGSAGCKVAFGRAADRGRISTPPLHPRPIPSPHDGEVGRGLGRGDSKERDNSMERAPLPPPSPRSCLAGRGSRCIEMRPFAHPTTFVLVSTTRQPYAVRVELTLRKVTIFA